MVSLLKFLATITILSAALAIGAAFYIARSAIALLSPTPSQYRSEVYHSVSPHPETEPPCTDPSH